MESMLSHVYETVKRKEVINFINICTPVKLHSVEGAGCLLWSIRFIHDKMR
jgi:hypothetical protein